MHFNTQKARVGYGEGKRGGSRQTTETMTWPGKAKVFKHSSFQLYLYTLLHINNCGSEIAKECLEDAWRTRDKRGHKGRTKVGSQNT